MNFYELKVLVAVVIEWDLIRHKEWREKVNQEILRRIQQGWI